jgi:hypothetical protein
LLLSCVFLRPLGFSLPAGAKHRFIEASTILFWYDFTFRCDADLNMNTAQTRHNSWGVPVLTVTFHNYSNYSDFCTQFLSFEYTFCRQWRSEYGRSATFLKIAANSSDLCVSVWFLALTQ